MYLLVAVRASIPFPLVYTCDVPAQVGQRVVVPLSGREVSGYIIQVDVTAPDDIQVKSIVTLIDEEPIFSAKAIEIADWIARVTFSSLGEVLFTLGPGAQKQVTERTRLTLSEEEPNYSDSLTDEQAAAVQNLQNQGGISYLWGITGSGKTHVFLHIMRSMRQQGKTVLYLVPEISLSYQTHKYLGSFFPDIALWHSGLTPAQKLKTWRAIQKGEKNIVLGTRSAILVPLQNLGLIILDEEHDTAYKSSSSPRYHARQVAMAMAKKWHIPLIMGSATPSIEAYYAMQQGTIYPVYLTKRVNNAVLPDVSIINMRSQAGIFSKKLITEIWHTKEHGQQSIVFLNRRGFARFYFCNQCGFELKCRQCSISMTYHKARNVLLCHYCGYQREKPPVCPQCGNPGAGFTTFGLEKAEEEARRIFVGMRIARLDGDIAKKKSDLQHILQAFRQGEIDVLLATQIVAKGFNFPHLHLVGVLSADVGLSMPDFRAEERVFTLLTQIAGRAGRYEDKGLVLVQTTHVDNPAIVYSTARDIKGFYQQQLTTRQDLGFPPYSRLLSLVFRSKNNDKARQAAYQAAQVFQNNAPADAELLGPSEAALSQVAGNYRWQILLRAPQFQLLHAWVQTNLSVVKNLSQVYCEIDGDPVSLL